MAELITWYDILGILPGASTEEVRYACEARLGQVSPQMISGAPSKVIKPQIVRGLLSAVGVASLTGCPWQGSCHS